MRIPLLAALLAAMTLALPAKAEASRTPVLLELFSSEGCSSCPPADVILADLIARQPVAGALLVGLASHVDYWDYLGWKDIYARPQLTERQKQVVKAIKTDGMYTPMLVIDGQAACVGSDRSAALAAIQAAVHRAHATLDVIHADATTTGVTVKVRVDSLPPGFGQRMLLLEGVVEGGKVTRQVTAGENAGKSLDHTALTGAIAHQRVDARRVPFEAEVGPIPFTANERGIVISLRTLDGVKVLGTQTLALPSGGG